MTLTAAVCVKQVPMLMALRFDTEQGRVIRDGVPLQVNPLDVVATIAATQALDGVDAELVAVSMGPPQAEQAVRHTMALGAARGVLVCDPRLAGSDTLATARVLAATVRRTGARLVVTGRHSVDAETGQTGAMLAALLGWPVVSGARRFRIDGDTVSAVRDLDDGEQSVVASLPCVVTVSEVAAEERWPRKAERQRAAEAPLQTWDLAALGLDAADVGAAGSPTSVGAARVITVERRGLRFEGSAAAAVESAVAALRPMLAATAARPVAMQGGEVSNRDATGAGPVWAVVEASGDGLRRVSAELVFAAARLARDLGTHAVAVALGTDASAPAQRCAAWGADEVHTLPDLGASRRDVHAHAAALASLVQQDRPAALLIPSTSWGRDLAGLLCGSLGLGLTGDAVGVRVEEGRVVALKPALGGSLIVPIACRTTPVVATVRSGALEQPEAAPARRHVAARECSVDGGDVHTALVEERSFTPAACSGDELETARIVVCAGVGLGEEGVDVAREQASRLGAALAATRRVCELGWLPRQLQVGLTGRSVHPDLYIACGVRGAFEHLTGIRGAGVVVAVNNDPEAQIFAASDVAIVGDAREVLPLLVERLRTATAVLAAGD